MIASGAFLGKINRNRTIFYKQYSYRKIFIIWYYYMIAKHNFNCKFSIQTISMLLIVFHDYSYGYISCGMNDCVVIHNENMRVDINDIHDLQCSIYSWRKLVFSLVWVWRTNHVMGFAAKLIIDMKCVVVVELDSRKYGISTNGCTSEWSCHHLSLAEPISLKIRWTSVSSRSWNWLWV